MKFNTVRGVFLSLLLSGGTPAIMHAFPPPPQHMEGHRGAEEGAAARNGFRDGEEDGRRDREHHRRSDPERAMHSHKNFGYERSFGERREYERAYRDAYLRGYDRGYHEEEHRR